MPSHYFAPPFSPSASLLRHSRLSLSGGQTDMHFYILSELCCVSSGREDHPAFPMLLAVPLFLPWKKKNSTSILTYHTYTPTFLWFTWITWHVASLPSLSFRHQDLILHAPHASSEKQQTLNLDVWRLLYLKMFFFFFFGGLPYTVNMSPSATHCTLLLLTAHTPCTACLSSPLWVWVKNQILPASSHLH